MEHFLELLTDPAHLAFEIFMSLAFDVLVLGVLAPFVKKYITRYVKREHARIDAEHGVEHKE